MASWCRHTLIKKLCQLRESEPELAQLLVDQVRTDWVWHPFLPWGYKAALFLRVRRRSGWT